MIFAITTAGTSHGKCFFGLFVARLMHSHLSNVICIFFETRPYGPSNSLIASQSTASVYSNSDGGSRPLTMSQMEGRYSSTNLFFTWSNTSAWTEIAKQFTSSRSRPHGCFTSLITFTEKRRFSPCVSSPKILSSSCRMSW